MLSRLQPGLLKGAVLAGSARRGVNNASLRAAVVTLHPFFGLPACHAYVPP